MMKFKEQSQETRKTVGKAVGIAALALAGVYILLLAFGGLIFGKNSTFYRSLNPFSRAGNVNSFIRIISLIFIVLIISYLIRLFLTWLETFLDKGKAFVNLLTSFIKYFAVIVLLYLVLQQLGVDTATLLAGVGILGLIVGLGAQPLIEDIISGLFIVFEGVFNVGDIIVFDGFRGEVKEIGVRTTQIVDAGGNIKVINNSDMRTLVNMTSQLSLAICDVQIEYGESLERVEAVIAKNIDGIREAIPAIVNGPFYKGVSELGSSGVALKFVAECTENTKFQVQRDLNRQIKLLFDANNINIPFTQVVVHQPTKFGNASLKDKKEAEEFVARQKADSNELPDSNYSGKI